MWLGLPTSSVPCANRRVCRAAVAQSGICRDHRERWTKTLIFIVVEPVMGFHAGVAPDRRAVVALRRSLPRRVDKTFRVLQLVSAAAYSWATTNDAQKDDWASSSRYW